MTIPSEDSELDKSWVSIKDVLPPQLTQAQKIDNFVSAIELYLEQLKSEPEISMFNFFNYSKKDKRIAATDLKQALLDAKAGLAVDMTFLDNKIYTDGRLKTLMSEHVAALGETNIHQLFGQLVQGNLAQPK